MKIPDELKEKIETTFSDNENLKNSLLDLDAKAIQYIGRMSQAGLNPRKVIDYYESGKIENIYKAAKKRVEAINIYHELSLIYTQIYAENEKNSESKRTER